MSVIPQADIFWDTNRWYWVDTTKLICENPGQSRIHDAIVDAIKNGYEIRGIRTTRGSVVVKTKSTVEITTDILYKNLLATGFGSLANLR